MSRVITVKKITEVASEREAIELITMLAQMSSNLDSKNKHYIGKVLVDKNISDWDIISINDSKEIYGTGWNYIKEGTEIEDYGKTKNEWLVNYDTGEIVQLSKNNYVELSSNDGLAIQNGIILNIDSKNMKSSDPSTWGDGVELHGFNEATGDGILLDGVDDYIQFRAGTDFKEGFTFSFYGIPYKDGLFFSKQEENNIEYSCRFGFEKQHFEFNTSKNRSNSDWAYNNGNNNGILYPSCSYSLGEEVFIDLVFETEENRFTFYKNGVLEGSTVVDSDYWNGNNGGRQIFEDNTIYCYVGRFFGGESKWNYIKTDIYCLRLYNKALSSDEINLNYNKTVTYHNLVQ